MPLETITYIPDLVAANPTTSDGLVQGDDHLRGIKAALRNTLPNWTAAVLNATQADLDGAVAVSKGTAATIVPAGTVTAPGIQTTGDTNTGVYFPAADEVAVTVGGVKAVHVHSDKSVELTGAATIAGALAVTGAITGPGSVPIGGTVMWWDDTLPAEGGWAWANGQILASANTVAPVLLARWGSRFGGNGVSTMGLPDMRETSPIGKSTMGATTTPGRITNYVATTIGGFIGLCNKVLTQANLPNINFNGTDNRTWSFPANLADTATGIFAVLPGGNNAGGSTTIAVTPSSTAISVASGGSGTAVDTVSPGTVCNFIVRLG